MADWYKKEAGEVVKELNTDISTGLSHTDVLSLIRIHGPNELVETGKRTLLRMFVDQFRDFMVIILLIAAAISAVLKEAADSLVILAVVGLNGFLGVLQESKAGLGRRKPVTVLTRGDPSLVKMSLLLSEPVIEGFRLLRGY